MSCKLNVCEMEGVMTVFDAWFSSLVYSFPCIIISVRSTFVIKSLKFSYPYPGALHLNERLATALRNIDSYKVIVRTIEVQRTEILFHTMVLMVFQQPLDKQICRKVCYQRNQK